MVTELTIGKLAEAADVNIETIRYYQRRGLLEEPPKPFRGHRRYPPDTVKRVRFIKRAQALGFTLAEVSGLLRLDAVHAQLRRVVEQGVLVRCLIHAERPDLALVVDGDVTVLPDDLREALLDELA